MKRFLNLILFLSVFLCFSNCYHSDKPSGQYLSILGANVLNRKITIVGDSLAQWSDGFGLRSRLPSEFTVTDLSVAGYTTEDWIQNQNRLNAIPTDLWILELGTNDAMVYGTSGFETRTLNLIDFLQSNQNSIVYLTLVPKTKMVSIQDTIRTNNSTLRAIQEKKPKVEIVDIESIFESYQGELPLYPISDPIHPNQIGYDLMGETYRKKILGI